MLFSILLEIFNEVQVKPKDRIGFGAFHSVYPNLKFQDKVIKTKHGGLTQDMEGKFHTLPQDNDSKLDLDEIETFQRHPDIFCKVYIVNERYAVLEKLDTKSISEESDQLEEAYITMFYKEGKDFIQQYYTGFTPEDIENFIGRENIEQVLYSHINDKKIMTNLVHYSNDKDLFLRYYYLFKKIKQANIKSSNGKVDLHKRNIGYNKEGELRLLDI